MPSDNWFDDIKMEIVNKLEILDEFLPAFKRSNSYVKLLQELDLIQQSTVEDDAISLNSLDGLDDMKLMEKKDELLKAANNFSYLSVECEKNIKHVRSLSDVTDLQTETLNECMPRDVKNGNLPVSNNDVQVKEEDQKSGEFTLSVRFIETGKE